jgi:hypothetical protein
MSSSVGEVNLQTLLASMQPQVHPAVFVFCTLPYTTSLPEAVAPLCQFREAEGITLILEQAIAERHHLPYQYPCRLITLTVHSSLTAVGLLATIAQALAAKGISVNVISAYYHDHLFVPCDRVDEAIACLHSL